MRIFYFHLHDGGDVLFDQHGVEMNLQDVSGRALREARALMAADLLLGSIDLSLAIVVVDADGRCVHRLGFGDAIKIHPAA